MSNPSIQSRIQWNIALNQYNSDTDSTESELDDQSVLNGDKRGNDVKDVSKVKTGSVQEVNKKNFFKEVRNRFNDNFQSKDSEISLQRNFENDTCLTEIFGGSCSEAKINERRDEGEIVKFEHLPNKCNGKSNNVASLPFKVLETNTIGLTEIVGEIWSKENNQNYQYFQKETNKCDDNVQKHSYNKSDDMGIPSHRNFEINTCLTDIIGKSWSEEMNENEQYNEGKTNKEEICSKVGRTNVTQSLQNCSEVEFSLTKIVREKWNENLKTNETSVYDDTLGEFTKTVIENVDSLLCDAENDNNKEIELNNRSEVYNKECDILKENLPIPIDQSNININSENLVEKVLVNSRPTVFDKMKSNVIDQVINYEMDIDGQVFDSSLLFDDNIQTNLNQNKNTFLEGLSLNLDSIGAEDIFYGNSLLRSPLKNQADRSTLPVHKPCNDRILNQKKGINKFRKKILKPKIFPEPLNSKIRGIPPRDPTPKRSCTLGKKPNAIMKKITKYRVRDENASLPKKRKMELIPTSKTSFKHSEHKPIKPENKKAKPNQLKLKAVKNAEVLVAIGARLDEIKIYITKWLSGDPETAVSRIDAINMLDYVKNILHEIKTMYTIKKPAPVKKLIDAANILELLIGKAISDADLLYKTEELQRLQALKYGNEDEIEDEDDSDSSSTSTSSSINDEYRSTHKVEVGKSIQQTKYQNEEIYGEHNITESLTELSLQETPLKIDNLQIVNTNLKSILKSKIDHENIYFQKKCLNFSDDIEYFEISQRPNKNIEETIAIGLDESLTEYNTNIAVQAKTSINNETKKSTIRLDEDIEMLEEEEEERMNQYKSDENNMKCMNSVLIQNNDNSLVVPRSNLNQNNSKLSQNCNYSGIKHIGTFLFRPESTNSEISEITQNKSSLANGNSSSDNRLESVTNSLEQPMNSDISNVNRNKTSIVKEMHISKDRLENSEKYSSKPESVISGNILNQNKSTIEQENNFSSDREEKTEKYSSKPEPVLSENILNQNKPPFAQKNYVSSNKLENTKSYSSKPECTSSGTDVNTSSSYFDGLQQMSCNDSLNISFSKFTLSEIDESWYKISVMGVKDVRIKSELEYYSSGDTDDDDWFNDWS